MNLYFDGTQLNYEVTLVDGNDAPVTVTAIEYLILDGKGETKQERIALSSFVSGSAKATIPLTTLINTMRPIADVDNYENVYQIREPRVIHLFLSTAQGQLLLTEIYGLQRYNVLVEGVNSMQSYSEAVMNALDFIGLDGWNNSSKDDRIAALIIAGRRIRDISFTFEAGDMRRVSYKLEPHSKLNHIGQEEYLQLDERFKQAVTSAQLLEANAILDSDEISELFAKGVTSVRIGETQQTFKETKSIKEPVCKEAMEFLRPYIKFQTKIGRA